jgi:hypothetical protein
MGRSDAVNIDRRVMMSSTVAALLGLDNLRSAAAPASDLDRIVNLVGDPDGYIDALLYAQFRTEAAKVAPDGDGVAEAARYASSFGDLLLHKALSEALWDSAERSLTEQQVVRTPQLETAETAIRVSETRTGRTRLSLYLEQAPKLLQAASKQSWAMLDGRAYTFIPINVLAMRGSVDARFYRLAALFAPTFPPAKRRWNAPGCPVGFDTEVAISHIRESDPAYTIYRAQICESAVLSAAVSTRGWRDANELVLKQDMELGLLQTKGKLANDLERSRFRGTPSLRYVIEGTTTALQFRAGRTWLIPQRKINVALSILSNTSVSEAATWLDRMEAALVLA